VLGIAKTNAVTSFITFGYRTEKSFFKTSGITLVPITTKSKFSFSVIFFLFLEPISQNQNMTYFDMS
jgi:hypothetical protein